MSALFLDADALDPSPGAADHAEVRRLLTAGVLLVACCQDRDPSTLTAWGLSQVFHPRAGRRGDRFPSPGLLVLAANSLGADLGRSWMLAGSMAAAQAAASAGCIGCILLPTCPDPPAGGRCPVVARAASLAEAPRVMVPPGGGCWHGAR